MRELTREEVLAMEPDRKLDALITDKVMGWTNVWRPFNPSIDISDAWEVVEKMRALGWWPVISSDSDKWNALFYWDTNGESFETQASTTPEAIAKAALLAVLEATP